MFLVFGLYLPQFRDFAGIPGICELPTSSKASRADLQPHEQPQPCYTHCSCSQSPTEGQEIPVMPHPREELLNPPHPKPSPATPVPICRDSAFPWVNSRRAGALGGAGLELLGGCWATAAPQPWGPQGWRRFLAQELRGCTGAGSRHPRMCNNYPELKLVPEHVMFLEERL